MYKRVARIYLLHYLALFFCITLFGTSAVILGQDVNWDLLQYHFYNGYAFLHHRFNHDIAPAMVQTYYNPFFDVINYLLISIQQPKITIFLLGSFTGISCFFLAKIANILFAALPFRQRILPIFFTLLIGFTGAGSISLLNKTTNDTKMATLVIIALYLLLKSLVINNNKILYLFGGAFIIGFCTGSKLPASCFNIALFAAFLFSQPLNRRHLYLCLGFGLFSAIGFLTVNGYWMYVLYEKFQNPIFPLYNNFFHSAYAPYLSFNFLLAKQSLYLYHLVFLPFFLAINNTFTSEVPLADMRLCAVFLLTFLFILKSALGYKTRSSVDNGVIRFLFIFFFFGYLIWLLLFFLYRYLLPLELLSGLLIVYLIYALFSSDRIRTLALASLLIIATATTYYPSWSAKHPYDKAYFILSTIPSLPANAQILLTSVPLAYVIPFFPKDTRFIGMPFLTIGINEATTAQISTKKYLLDVMKDVKTQIDVMPTFILSYETNDHFDIKSKKVLNYFNLIEDEEHCQPFMTNIGHRLSLCPLVRRDN